eukprot:TRINITY_DN11117_c0_g1_i1.p1 TRINITY_DN11117_c0_g1~~TRINITY_DN11117_c0_g1_i1.p1  ORF type:complete len:727 (+),score=141.18 TRINITY_DN11117_c0_g1_i1:143-2182(+)
MNNAFPADELKPISCTPRDRNKENRGHLDDILGEYCLTLVDSLDTLVVLGDLKEFERGIHLLSANMRLDNDVTVSLFEATIRVLGGLLSSHLYAQKLSSQFEHPYHDELLDLAQELGNRMLPAFSTPTGIPFSRVNLKNGIVKGGPIEITTAEVGTLLMEWGMLSRLTGDMRYENAARRALNYIWSQRSPVNLLGSAINVLTGKWVRTNSGIGAGFDSFYEYLLKCYILFGDYDLYHMFHQSYEAVERYIKVDGWYGEVNMQNGDTSKDYIDSLQSFWPGLQVLMGDITSARTMHDKLYHIWKQHGCMPEAYSPKANAHLPTAGGYPLRPEFVESTYFMYRSTKDPHYLEVGKRILYDLQNTTRVACGFASIAEIGNKRLEDRMDSYFLTETLKYLYLLFDVDNDFHHEQVIFTTEGHPFPLSFKLKPVNSDVKVSELTCPKIPKMEWPLPEPSSSQPPLPHNQCTPGASFMQIKMEYAFKGYASIRILPEGTEVVAAPAIFGPILSMEPFHGMLALTEPSDGCSPIVNFFDVVGKIAFIQRGGCSFVEKVQHAARVGAIAAVIANNQDGHFTMSYDKDPSVFIPIPSVLIQKSDADWIQSNQFFDVELHALQEYKPEDLSKADRELQIVLETNQDISNESDHQTLYLQVLQQLRQLGIIGSAATPGMVIRQIETKPYV